MSEECYRAYYKVLENKAAQNSEAFYEFEAKTDDRARKMAEKHTEALRKDLSKRFPNGTITLDRIIHEREVPLTAEE